MILDSHSFIDGLRIYYKVAGSKGKPPAIFLHGWGSRIDAIGSYAGIAGIVEELSKNFVDTRCYTKNQKS